MSGQQHPTLINVASSTYVLEGYVNLDNSVFYRAQVVYPILRKLLRRDRVEALERYRAAARRARVVLHDCRKPLPFDDGSVDHVLCSHFLEHVYPDEASAIVADYWRVLRASGTLHLIVPDLRRMAKEYLASCDPRAAHEFVRGTLLGAEQPTSLLFRALTLLGYEGLMHRWMYDQQSLTRLVEEAGFELVDRSTVPSALFRSEPEDQSVHIAARKPRPS